MRTVWPKQQLALLIPIEALHICLGFGKANPTVIGRNYISPKPFPFKRLACKGPACHKLELGSLCTSDRQPDLPLGGISSQEQPALLALENRHALFFLLKPVDNGGEYMVIIQNRSQLELDIVCRAWLLHLSRLQTVQNKSNKSVAAGS